jgi:cellulose synthase/poly-beta-1,6-N-acetylglucosamine synthase-like glycosyltransferase
VFNTRALALLLLDAIIVGVIIVQPLGRRFDDSDRGHGTVVDMPPFGRPSLRRAGGFLGVAVVISVVIVAVRHPDLAQAYRAALTGLLRWVIRDPAAVAAVAGRVPPLIPAAFTGYLVTVAIVFPATVGRRIMILLHVPLFLGVSLLADTVLAAIEIAAHITLGPAPLLAMYLQYLVGYLVVFRLFFTSHRLPRLTPVPRLRRGDWPDGAVLVLCVLGASGLVFAASTVLYRAAGASPGVAAIILIPVQMAMVDVLAVLLVLTGRIGGQRPRPGAERPPLNIIIPAFNESLGIERLLWSIDRAAGAYGGLVHVIMCDDGSTDDTAELAQAVMDGYRHATGEIIEGGHHGKSRALNLALARCTAEFVYRLDADCAIDQNAFVYSVADFLADPRTGLVGALHAPKEPYTTWLDRMRAIELLYSFGFLRAAQAQIDAVPGVPGSFCAFRRSAALAVGGFVHGMYGEDTEFTCAVARLGYRVVIDTRVVTYEDVPTTVRQLRVQRFRWGIGGRLVYTRFTPFSRQIGAPGPRFWFQMTRGAGIQMLSPAYTFMALLSLAYAIALPGAHHNLLRWVSFLALAQTLALLPRIAVLAYYRRLRRLLPWAVLWIPFVLLKRFFLLEALLAYGMRPVKPPLALRPRYPTWRALLTRPGRPAGAVAPAEAP